MSLKQKRLSLITKINKLMNLCSCAPSVDNNCTNCNEIKSLGQQLMFIKNGGKPSVQYIEETRNVRKPGKSPVEMELKEYDKLKKQGLSDPEIASSIGVTIGVFKYWKKTRVINQNKNLTEVI